MKADGLLFKSSMKELGLLVSYQTKKDDLCTIIQQRLEEIGHMI